MSPRPIRPAANDFIFKLSLQETGLERLAAGRFHVGADLPGPAGALLYMNPEKLTPATEQVHSLVAGSVEIDRTAFEIVIVIDGGAVLHAADADHAFVQVSFAVEDHLPSGRLIGIDQVRAVDFVPVIELAGEMHRDPAVAGGIFQRRNDRSA